jgi:phosphate transport system substrate-binding protein
VSRTRNLAFAAALSVPALLPSIARAQPIDAHASAKPTITMSGSTSIFPLAEDLVRAYLKKYPGSVTFRISQGGSDIGVQDAALGRASIGNSSRDPLPSDPHGLTFTKIARDGVCVVTNTANPIANISQQQVQDIFSGTVRRWDDVDGAKVTGPIDLVVRTQSSGTQDAFKNIFMGPTLNVASSAAQKQSNGLVQAAVRADRAAIGYVDFRFTAGTHAADYQGVSCDLRNAASGQYAGVRNFWMVTRGKPAGPIAKFLSFVRSSTVQNSIVAKNYVRFK